MRKLSSLIACVEVDTLIDLTFKAIEANGGTPRLDMSHDAFIDVIRRVERCHEVGRYKVSVSIELDECSEDNLRGGY